MKSGGVWRKSADHSRATGDGEPAPASARRGSQWRAGGLVADSPLRRVDPRTKLALSICISLAVMLPLERLLVVIGAYLLLLAWARLLPAAARLVWRLKWVLLILFALDWWVISLDFAILITLRIVLLSGAFAILFVTSTSEELRLAFEWLRLPYRYAFSLSLALHSVGLFESEWRTIREAQQARGAWSPLTGWRDLGRQAHDLVALTVPAVVMTAHRAWAMTEAAYARGFDSPHRRPYHRLAMHLLDWLLLAGAFAGGTLLVWWR